MVRADQLLLDEVITMMITTICIDSDKCYKKLPVKLLKSICQQLELSKSNHKTVTAVTTVVIIAVTVATVATVVVAVVQSHKTCTSVFY